MRDAKREYHSIVQDMHDIARRRDQAISDAFETLERCDPRLASMLCQRHRSRREAALWMNRSLREWQGRCAYELLADGEADLVWDKLTADEALYQ